MKIFKKPLTDEEHLKKNVNILKTPIRYHLIDVLKELKFGRPSNNQQIIDKWIGELEDDLEKGVPFT